MTEAEAKTKWCPMVRFNTLDINESDSNRGVFVRSGNIQCCIASDCMMWRSTGYTDHGMTGKSGYCGLAGKP